MTTPWVERREIGPCTLYLGDAMRIIPTVPAKSVALTLVDPPYSSGGMFRSDRNKPTGAKYVQTEIYQSGKACQDFAGDNRDQRGWTRWCERWLALAGDAAESGVAIILFVDWRQLPALTDAVQVAGLTWRGVAVWDKTESSRPYKGWFRAQCEYLVLTSRGPLTLSAGPPYMPGLFRYGPLAGGIKLHQTGKPEPLMRDLLRICRPGGLVADWFMGSGTTLVEALRAGHPCIGVELDPGIYATACARIEKAWAAVKDLPTPGETPAPRP